MNIILPPSSGDNVMKESSVFVPLFKPFEVRFLSPIELLPEKKFFKVNVSIMKFIKDKIRGSIIIKNLQLINFIFSLEDLITDITKGDFITHFKSVPQTFKFTTQLIKRGSMQRPIRAGLHN